MCPKDDLFDPDYTFELNYTLCCTIKLNYTLFVYLTYLMLNTVFITILQVNTSPIDLCNILFVTLLLAI